MNRVPLVAAVLVACVLAGGALAATGGAGGSSIRACAKKRGGALRIAKKCAKGERRVTWAVTGPRGVAGAAGATGATGATGPAGTTGTPGTDGAPGTPGTPATPGTPGTNGTSTGETFFQSAGAGSNFGAGGTCSAVPSGPSITVTVPSGSYAQIMASVTSQRTGGTTSNTACVHVDSSDVPFSASTSLATETRYLVQGDGGTGTTDPLSARPITVPLSAGSHTISLRYGSNGGTSQFTNRNLYVTVFHPTQ